MTLSALASIFGGIVKPICLALFTLIYGVARPEVQ
jgi:hypothetical protein